jgi:hypothetical protein
VVAVSIAPLTARRVARIRDRVRGSFKKMAARAIIKTAAIIENVIPTICVDPVVTISSLAEIF